MIGLGLSIPSLSRARGPLIAFQGMPRIEPGPLWTGTAGSGFASTPSDPVRTTAKPAVRLITVPDQRFTDELEIGVMAFANGGGTLIGGIDRVRLHFEGNSIDILQPRVNRLVDSNGVDRSYWGYWARLKKPVGRTGHANLYIEAIPADATMQRRVIGPFKFSPADTLYDIAVTVDPDLPQSTGANFHTVGAAINYFKSQRPDSMLITVKKALVENLGVTGVGGTGHTGANYCTITAEAPVTFARPSHVGDAAGQIATGANRLHFKGRNITFDMRHNSALWSNDIEQHWLDGCRFVNSGGMGNTRWRGRGRPYGFLVRGQPWFTEVEFVDVPNMVTDASLARGCKVVRGFGDFAGQTGAVVYNEMDGLDSTQDWLIDIPALRISYTGAETTATVASSGSRIFTLAWGANSASFNANNSETRFNLVNQGGFNPVTSASGYWPQHLAAWINSLPGWSATVLNNASVATSLSLAGLKGIGFSARNAKNTTLELVSCFDFHGDFLQISNFPSPNHENGIIAFNRGKGQRGQNLFVVGVTHVRDFFMVNNAFSNVPSDVGYASYLEAGSALSGSPHSHVCFVHNSMPTQILRLGGNGGGYTADAFCLVANNAVMDIRWNGQSAIPALTIRDNIIDGIYTAPGGDQNTVIAGDYRSKFFDSINGDFRPLGALQSVQARPSFSVSLGHEARQAAASFGAV